MLDLGFLFLLAAWSAGVGLFVLRRFGPTPDEPADALAELRRVLRPGGSIALSTSDWSRAKLRPRTANVDAALRGRRVKICQGNLVRMATSVHRWAATLVVAAERATPPSFRRHPVHKPFTHLYTGLMELPMIRQRRARTAHDRALLDERVAAEHRMAVSRARDAGGDGCWFCR